MAVANPQPLHENRLNISLPTLSSFPNQSGPNLTYFLTAVLQIPPERCVHVPPLWLITDTYFYTRGQFCGFPVGFKHLGLQQHCQVSAAGNLLSKLASFTPCAEDPSTHHCAGCAGLQPSLLLAMWYKGTSSPHGLARAHPRIFPGASMVITPMSAFPTDSVDPLSTIYKNREALSRFRPALHVLVQK